MVKIRVPASTANMGPGFDCIGMAFELYNELTLEEADQFSITTQGIESAANFTSKDSLTYRTIESFYAQIGKPLPTLRLTQRDSIPMARGLGSSAACIVAGLMAANQLSGQGLPRSEITNMACKIDGHPDNVASAILGGLIVGTMDKELKYVKITPSQEISFVALIPNFSLRTEESRSVLPTEYTRADVIFNTSRASLFVSSMLTGNWDNLSVATQDRIHQPYRKTLIPDMDTIFAYATELGAKGMFLSGAGPTIMTIILRAHEEEFLREMTSRLGTLVSTWEMLALRPDNEGARIL